MGWAVDSLKRKFKELHKKTVPTSNPNCPPAVAWAERLRHHIINRMDATDLNYLEDNVEEDEEDPDTNLIFLGAAEAKIFVRGGLRKGGQW